MYSNHETSILLEGDLMSSCNYHLATLIENPYLPWSARCRHLPTPIQPRHVLIANINLIHNSTYATTRPWPEINNLARQARIEGLQWTRSWYPSSITSQALTDKMTSPTKIFFKIHPFRQRSSRAHLTPFFNKSKSLVRFSRFSALASGLRSSQNSKYPT